MGCGNRQGCRRARRPHEVRKAVAFYSDGSRVLTGSGDATARLWDTATEKTVATLEGHTGPVWAVAFSPDGAPRVVTGSWDTKARLWDAVTGKMLARLEPHGPRLGGRLLA